MQISISAIDKATTLERKVNASHICLEMTAEGNNGVNAEHLQQF